MVNRIATFAPSSLKHIALLVTYKERILKMIVSILGEVQPGGSLLKSKSAAVLLSSKVMEEYSALGSTNADNSTNIHGLPPKSQSAGYSKVSVCSWTLSVKFKDDQQLATSKMGAEKLLAAGEQELLDNVDRPVPIRRQLLLEVTGNGSVSPRTLTSSDVGDTLQRVLGRLPVQVQQSHVELYMTGVGHAVFRQGQLMMDSVWPAKDSSCQTPEIMWLWPPFISEGQELVEVTAKVALPYLSSGTSRRVAAHKLVVASKGKILLQKTVGEELSQVVRLTFPGPLETQGSTLVVVGEDSVGDPIPLLCLPERVASEFSSLFTTMLMDLALECDDPLDTTFDMPHGQANGNGSLVMGDWINGALLEDVDDSSKGGHLCAHVWKEHYHPFLQDFKYLYTCSTALKSHGSSGTTAGSQAVPQYLDTLVSMVAFLLDQGMSSSLLYLLSRGLENGLKEVWAEHCCAFPDEDIQLLNDLIDCHSYIPEPDHETLYRATTAPAARLFAPTDVPKTETCFRIPKCLTDEAVNDFVAPEPGPSKPGTRVMSTSPRPLKPLKFMSPEMQLAYERQLEINATVMWNGFPDSNVESVYAHYSQHNRHHTDFAAIVLNCLLIAKCGFSGHIRFLAGLCLVLLLPHSLLLLCKKQLSKHREDVIIAGTMSFALLLLAHSKSAEMIPDTLIKYLVHDHTAFMVMLGGVAAVVQQMRLRLQLACCLLVLASCVPVNVQHDVTSIAIALKVVGAAALYFSTAALLEWKSRHLFVTFYKNLQF